MDDMFFSVCIPSYRSRNRIENAVKSIVDQQYDKYEIIICDQGDTDSSFLLRKYDNIRIIHLDHPSTYNARATLVQAVKGDYFIQLDDDDILAPNTLNTLSGIITDTGLCDLYCYKKQNVPNDNRDVIDDNCVYSLSKDDFIKRCLFYCEGYYNDMVTKCIKKIPNFDFIPKKMTNNEDGLLLLELVDYCFTFVQINTTFYYCIKRDGSASKERSISSVNNQCLYILCLYRKVGLNYTYQNVKSTLYSIFNYLFYLYKKGNFTKNEWRVFCRDNYVNDFRHFCLFHLLTILANVECRQYLILYIVNSYYAYRFVFKIINRKK